MNKTYDAATLASMLGVNEHQCHYLWRRGLIPAPIIHSGTVIRWSAEHVDYYLTHGMQKFQEVYCEV